MLDGSSRPVESLFAFLGSSELARGRVAGHARQNVFITHIPPYKHVHVRQFVNVSDRAKMNAIRRGAEDPSEDTYMSTCDVTSDMRNETHLTPRTDTPGISPAGSRQMQHMHRSAIPISHIDLIRLRTVVFRSSSAILYVRSSMHVAVRVRGPPPCHRHFAGVIRS